MVMDGLGAQQNIMLEKATLVYDVREDRIRMSASYAGGRTVVLWLTQRLVKKLVVALCAYLGRQDQGASKGDMHQACLQREAEWSFAASEPVPVMAAVPSFLPQKVDVAFGDQALQLRFPVLQGSSIILPLASRELRQWLAIMFRVYRQASWPVVGVWPEWFDGSHFQQN